MGVVSETFSTILDGFGNRREELQDSADSIALLQSPPDLLAKKYSDAIASSVSGLLPGGATAGAISSASAILKNMFDSIPENILSNKFTPDAALHSQLTGTVQGFLLGDNVEKNFAGVLGKATQNTANKITGFQSALEALKEKALESVADLKKVAQGSSGFGTIPEVKTKIPVLNNILNDLRQKTVRMQARVLTGGLISKGRVDSIISDLSSMKGLSDETKSLSSILYERCERLENAATNITELFNDVMSTFNDVSNMKDNFLKDIRPGDVFNTAIRHIRDLYDQMENDLSTVLSGLDQTDVCQLMASLGNYLGKVSAVEGLVKTFANKSFATALTNTDHPSVRKMNSFITNAKAAYSTTKNTLEHYVGKFDRDVKAVEKLAKRLANNSTVKNSAGKDVPKYNVSVDLVDQLASRMESSATQIFSGMSVLNNVINAFQPQLTGSVTAFLESVGQQSKLALDSLLQGKISRFENVLKSPKYLTLYGQAAVQLEGMRNRYEKQLTIGLRAKLGDLGASMAGLHSRQALGSWLVNVPVQRSQTLKELDLFVKKHISPLELLTKEVQKDMQVVENSYNQSGFSLNTLMSASQALNSLSNKKKDLKKMLPAARADMAKIGKTADSEIASLDAKLAKIEESNLQELTRLEKEVKKDWGKLKPTFDAATAAASADIKKLEAETRQEFLGFQTALGFLRG